MAIWQAIGRSAAWPIFFASPADRLTLRRGMAAMNSQLFCRRPAPKKPTRSDAGFANGCPSDREEPLAFRERWHCGLSRGWHNHRNPVPGSGSRALQDEATAQVSLTIQGFAALPASQSHPAFFSRRASTAIRIAYGPLYPRPEEYRSRQSTYKLDVQI